MLQPAAPEGNQHLAGDASDCTLSAGAIRVGLRMRPREPNRAAAGERNAPRGDHASRDSSERDRRGGL